MTFSPPVVPGVTGLAREDFIFDHTDNPASGDAELSRRRPRSGASQDQRARNGDRCRAPRRPALSVTFESPTKVSIKRPEGFDAGAIYELIYTAKDPKVMGLGFAATRDIVSFLRHEKADARGHANPLAGRIDKRDRLRPVAERPLPARLSLSRLQR